MELVTIQQQYQKVLTLFKAYITSVGQDTETEALTNYKTAENILISMVEAEDWNSIDDGHLPEFNKPVWCRATYDIEEGQQEYYGIFICVALGQGNYEWHLADEPDFFNMPDANEFSPGQVGSYTVTDFREVPVLKK
jgi:hypothetical protein